MRRGYLFALSRQSHACRYDNIYLGLLHWFLLPVFVSPVGGYTVLLRVIMLCGPLLDAEECHSPEATRSTLCKSISFWHVTVRGCSVCLVCAAVFGAAGIIRMRAAPGVNRV